MVSIASILLLTAIVSHGCGETTVSILEDPVLLEFNATHTALRCSIEVHGSVRPRIDFFFNNLSYSEHSWMRCNGVDVPPFSPDNSFQAEECGNSTYRIRYQVFFVRTCFGDSRYTGFIDNTVVQCAPSSTAVNLTATSNRVILTYNERHEPRLVPETVPLESLRVQEGPVCPREPVGVLSLQSPVSTVSPTSTIKEVDSTSLTQTSTSFIATTGTSTPSRTIPGPFGSSPDAPPTQSLAPPSQSPSASTAPSSSSNPSGSPTPNNGNRDGESLSTFTEDELKLIIFVATGVAVFFAGVVVCLLCVLCCVLTKRRKNTNLSGSRKKAMEGLTDNDDRKETIRLERLERASLSPIQTGESRERQQFALHRGSSGSSASNSNSIDSDTLGRDHPSGNPTTGDVIVAEQHSRNCTAVTNPLVEEVITSEAVVEHDYDYIDDSKLTSSSPGKNNTPVQAAAAPTGKKNSYVKGPLEGEYNVPRLCVSGTQSEGVQGFPVTDSLKRECAVQLSSALLSEETKMEKQPNPDYVNRPNDIHHYQNSLMIGTDIHDYQNSNAVQCGTQTIPAISDSYQELHTISDDDLTVGDSSSSSYFNHLKEFPRTSGYEAETTSSSCFEQVPTGLSHVQRTHDEQGTSGEPYYHTVIPGGGTSDSSCSTGAYSLPPDVRAMIKSKSSGPTGYNNPLLKHEGSSKTVPQVSKREHVYKDLDTYKMDAPTDYTDLQKSLNTSIGTQTYA